jgi:CSLREA domain-containing protein
MFLRSLLQSARDAISRYRGHRARSQARAGRQPQRNSPKLELLEHRWLLSTFFVNTTDDNNDRVCDRSHCSLREAIEAANETDGRDLIRFNISVQGIPSIRPTSQLPAITDPVTIDGTTQSAGRVELNGNTVSADGDWRAVRGFVITGGDSRVRGMVINRFASTGIYLGQGGESVIEGNRIGTDVTGLVAGTNGSMGVWIFESSGNTIVSANGHSGIHISIFEPDHAAEHNVIQGNVLGTNLNGTGDLGNVFYGFSLDSASNNTIGGLVAGARNLIGGNEYGVGINSTLAVALGLSFG